MSKRTKSAVWNYFDKDDSDEAKCKMCSKKVKTSKNTSNLSTHLARHHKDAFEEFKNKQQGDQAVGSKTSSNVSTSVQQSIIACMEQSQTYESSSVPKQKIDDALIKMICKDMQPASIVEDDGFKNLISVLDKRYQLPSRRTIMRKILPDLYEAKKAEIVAQLKTASFIALTTDLWTLRQTESYITLTCYYVRESEMKSVILKTDVIESPHTAEMIAASIMDIMNEFDIEHGNVSALVTDNASNMSAAARILNMRHIPCFAHTLNLIVKSAIAKCEIVRLIKEKLQKLVGYSHRSVKAADRLREIQTEQKQEQMKLVNGVETRWNSTHKMFQRYLEMHTVVTTTLGMVGRVDLIISDDEFNTIRSAVAALQPFLVVTTEISADENVSLSKLIVLTRSLVKHVAQDKDKNPLSRELMNELTSRRFTIMETFSEIAMSTYLDPRFKRMAFKDEAALANAKRKVEDKMRLTKHDIQDAPPFPPPEESTAQPSKSSSELNLWADFTKEVAQATFTRSKAVEVCIELQRYDQDANIPLHHSPLLYWEKNKLMLPRLYQVAMKYLSIPATSIPSEQVFSKA